MFALIQDDEGYHRNFDPRRDMRCPTYQNPSPQIDDTAGAFTSRVRTNSLISIKILCFFHEHILCYYSGT
jgi:hypothetical protein